MLGLTIAAPCSGAGKTMLTLGLLRALRGRGVDVVSAKSGPDYIDPQFHVAASGGPCLTLDAWAMRPERLRALAAAHTGALLVIEGAMGLFDGAPDAESPFGRGSTADLCAMLKTPVVLVLDVAGQAQSAAAIARGMAEFSDAVDIIGVILNRVGSPRHGAMVRIATEAGGLPVFGIVPSSPHLAAPSRHLGLVQAREHPRLEAFIEKAAELVREHVDLDAVVAAAAPLRAPRAETPVAPLAPLGQRIAIARDDAFAFLYPHMLADWHRQGAGISFFSPLAGEAPDAAADAVFLPGGYPELHACRLAAAADFRAGVSAAAERGALVYGECGGFMTLGTELVDGDGTVHRMLGLLPLATSFARRRLHLGYRHLRPLAGAPWGRPLAAHEFHYATTLRCGDAEPLFEVTDAVGLDLAPMGLRKGRVMGSFAHVIDYA